MSSLAAGRKRLPVFVVIGCLIVLGGCSRDTDTRGASKACSAEVPELAQQAPEGTIESQSDPRVVAARRDRTMTLVGFCVEELRLDPSPPSLVDRNSKIEPIGGFFSDDGQGTVNFSLYPPTAGDRIAVVDAGKSLAHIRYPALPEESCGLATRGPGPVVVLDCATLVVLEWRTDLTAPAKTVELVDVEVSPVAEAGPSRLMDFYLHGLSNSPTGNLQIRFAVANTGAAKLRLFLKDVFLRKDREVKKVRVRDEQLIRLRDTARPK